MQMLDKKRLEKMAGEGNEYALVTISTKVSAKEALGLLDLVDAMEEEMTPSRYMRNLLRDRLGLGPVVYLEYAGVEEYYGG